MCIDERFVDRYPDGKEDPYREVTLCSRSRAGRLCSDVSIKYNNVRNIQYGEPSTEYIRSQISTPRSSTSSLRPNSPMMYEIINDGPSRSRERRESKSYTKDKKRDSFLLNTFFGEPARRSKTYTKPTNHVRFADDELLSPPPAVPRRTTSYRTSNTYRRPLTPPRDSDYVYTPVPISPSAYPSTRPPTRGRSPIIIDARGRGKRSDSTDAVISDRPSPPPTSRTTPTRRASVSTSKPSKAPRQSSPTLSELAAEEAERERLRRIRRDDRAARIEAELLQSQEARERERRRALLDAEIMSRPAVPPSPTSPLSRSPRLDIVEPIGSSRRWDERGRRRDERDRVVLDQTSSRLQGVLADAELSRRGQQVILKAMEERRKAAGGNGLSAAVLDERDERLRRRFDGPIGRERRERPRGRIVYDDGTVRYD